MATTTNLSTLKINYLTQAQFDALTTKEANEIYLTPDNSITSVSAGSGLSGGGSSGTVTLNHSNSVTAKTTQALYPITFDAQGHITGAGTAVTSLPASDVYSWAKASSKPTYTASEVGALASNTTYVSTITTTAGTHSAISSKSGAVSFNVPTKTSHLTNDSGFITGITAAMVKTALGTGSGTTKFLREDGSWATPAYTTNTDSKLQVAEVTSATQYYPLVGTGTTAATRQYDTTGFKYKGTNGTTSAVGSSILELGNSTASGTANNKQAQLVMYGSNAKKATITLAAPSADIALALPTSAGTLALTSQIPTTLPASDVYSWAKASTKPSYTASEVGALSSSTTYVSTITTSAGTHTTVSSKSGAVSFNIPTKTSHLTNDSGFITSDSDENVKSTTVTAATTNYIVGSTSSSTATGGLSKHASAVMYTTADSGTSGYTQLRLGNTTETSTAGGKEGQIRLYGTTATYYVTLKAGAPSSNRTITFPNATGTVALTSDIPTIPSNNVTGSGTSGYLVKWNGANSITSGPQIGSSTTTYLRNDGSWATPTNTDTKNTAGSTDTSSKIYLIGATSQAANPQTYSHDTTYVGTDGCLYSGGSKVLTSVPEATASSAGLMPAAMYTMVMGLQVRTTDENKTGIKSYSIDGRFILPNDISLRGYKYGKSSTTTTPYADSIAIASITPANHVLIGNNDYTTTICGNGIYLDNEIYVNGHTEPVGDVNFDLNSTSFTMNSSGNFSNSGKSLTLSAGTYVLVAKIEIGSSINNGYVGLEWYSNSSTDGGVIVHSQVTCPMGASGYATRLQSTCIVNPSADTTYNIWAYQSSGTNNVTISLSARAVRIK